MRLTLIRPTLSRAEDWAACVAEFGGGAIHGSGMIGPVPATRSTCEALVARASLLADQNAALPAGLVHADIWWIDVAGQIVGTIDFRRSLTEYLFARGGQIGYSVAPSYRRRGYAAAALEQVLARAQAAGYSRVLLTCEAENVASAHVIERAGGVEDHHTDFPGADPMIRRYWVTLNSASLETPTIPGRRE